MTSREQLQALIRAEIDRQRPVAVARRTLELLVESAIRRHDAPPGYQVVDRDGRPRTRTVAGEVLPLTLGDLVDELRRQHPTLFQPPAAPAAPTEAPRDWIVVQPTTPPASSPPPAPRPDRFARLRDALGDLSNRLRPPRRETAGPAVAAMPEPLPLPPGEGLKPGLARPRPLPGGGLPRRPLYAALGTLAVLGVAYATLRGGGEPAREAAVAQAPAPGIDRPSGKPANVGQPDRKTTDVRPAETRPPEARTTPGDRAAPAKPTEGRREPVETGALVPEAGGPSAGPLAGVAEVLDTATLRLGGRTLRLYGVEAAKGAQAGDLTGYLAGRPVNCQPNPGRTAWICTVDGHDLSEVVLYNGGGRATAEATPDLVEAERHARTARLGIWAKP